MPRHVTLAIAVLALSALACGQYVPTVTPTPSPVPPTAAATATPEPTRTPEPTATAEAELVQTTATVRQAVVNIRSEPGGAVIGYLEAGDEVTVLEIDGDWVRVAEGWIWAGCLDGVDSQKGCEAE